MVGVYGVVETPRRSTTQRCVPLVYLTSALPVYRVSPISSDAVLESVMVFRFSLAAGAVSLLSYHVVPVPSTCTRYSYYLYGQESL